MKAYKNLLLNLQGKTAIVTMNRPDKLNALNKETLAELSECLQELAQDSAVRGLIITGAGEKAFVAGADIAEFQAHDAAAAKALSAWGHTHIMDFIQAYPKPVIAAINGFALGGGLELAMACHMRMAVETARMGLPEVSLGLIPGYGGTQRLTALVGSGKAMEMILTADMITAAEALQWGLVNHVLAAEDLIPSCMQLLEKIYTRSATAVTAAIKAINAYDAWDVDGYAQEINAFGEAFQTADFKEGVAAFLAKRKPDFK